ncbi:MAG TPA: heme-binding protein, partial [Usitatibacter sp.]|nr:heme-binding protein [Usitatibacter sp.]
MISPESPPEPSSRRGPGFNFLVAGLLAATPVLAASDGATFTVRSLTPETALKAAQGALAKCRDNGYQVAVAVVDREGLTQVLLRDRYAGAHTIETATNKAWS